MDDKPHSAFYTGLAKMNFRAGWMPREGAPSSAPEGHFRPALWRFADAREALDEAATFVSTEQAERRNLVMVNPWEGNIYATTRTLVAAYQMVGPGEKARSHRHTPAALRLVVDTEAGVYTVVDGKRIDMVNGEVVLTPAWCWHGHANESGHPGYWIDFLDSPFIRLIDTNFFEPYPEPFEKVQSAEPDSPYRIPPSRALKDSVPATVEIARDVMPTIGLHLIAQSAGGKMDFAASTANNLYSLVSGKARFEVEGGFDHSVSPGDVIAVPARHAHHLTAVGETATMLRVTDEPLLARLGLLRNLP